MSLHAQAPASVVSLWDLRGETSLRVECWISEAAAEGWALIITYGSETVLYETYPDRTTATSHAEGLKEQLMQKGWKPSAS